MMPIENAIEVPQNGAAYKSLTMSPSVKALAVALIAAQAELPKIPKDKVNPFFNSKYVGLDTLMPLALEVLNKHGLGLVQSVGQDSQGGTTLTTILLHESGEWLSDTQPLLLVKTDPQGQGSAITYGRRYALMAMLGLVAEDDDDGNAASQRPAPPRPAARQAPSASRSPAPPPVDRPAYDENTKIGDGQVRGIRGGLDRIFAKDEKAQYDWMKEVMPRACEASATAVHLGELTMAEGSTVLAAINERMNRDG